MIILKFSNSLISIFIVIFFKIVTQKQLFPSPSVAKSNTVVELADYIYSLKQREKKLLEENERIKMLNNKSSDTVLNDTNNNVSPITSTGHITSHDKNFLQITFKRSAIKKMLFFNDPDF